MGVTWSSPRDAKKNTLLVISAEFPKDKVSRDQIWALWKLRKEQIRKDGFSVSKFKGAWKIAYFHIKNSQSEKNVDGEKMYLVEFKQKYNKWYQTMKNLLSADHKQVQQKEDEKIFDEAIAKNKKSEPEDFLASDEIDTDLTEEKEEQSTEKEEQSTEKEEQSTEIEEQNTEKEESEQESTKEQIQKDVFPTEDIEGMLDVWDDLNEE